MKKILLATDGSVVAESAAQFLAHLPHKGKIEVTIVSALFVPSINKAYLVGDWIKKSITEERKKAVDSFARIEAMFEGANVLLRHDIREGHPGEVIVDLANELQPDLLVLGATGHSSIARMLLGSVSDYVATHAPCSVLVVRPKPKSKKKRFCVAIAYEECAPAKAALDEFGEFGWGGDSDVRVVSVTHQPGFYDLPDEDPSAKFVEAAAERLRKVAPSAVDQLVHSDHFGEGLIRYIESNDVDLAVVGETPRTRLGRVLMGSMTRYVLRHASCSVWITRGHVIEDV